MAETETPYSKRTVATRFAFLAPDEPEWEVAWSHFDPDRVRWNEAYHEALQYLGSVQTLQGYWRHEFRHRAVPGTNERQYWYITATEGWQPA